MRKPVAVMVRTLDSEGRWIDHEVKYEDAFRPNVKRAVVAALCGLVDETDVRWPTEGSEDDDLLTEMAGSIDPDAGITGWWQFVIGLGEDRRHALVWEIWN